MVAEFFFHHFDAFMYAISFMIGGMMVQYLDYDMDEDAETKEYFLKMMK